MFRKYYKEANDSIKPSEDFVNSVINNAIKHKPPLRARYVKYAAMAAAAAVIITGAVTAMPALKRASLQSDDIVIIEETVTDESAAKTHAPVKEEVGDAFAAQSSIHEPKNTPSHNTSENSYSVPDNTPHKVNYFPVPEPDRNTKESAAVTESDDGESLAGDTAMVDETVSDDSAADEYGIANISTYADRGAAGGSSVVLGETSEIKARKMSEPEDMTPYAAKQDLSDISENDEEAIDDADIPCPDGYYCINSTPNGYTFKNDSGAVISVIINYGGADREPYISEDGDNIYAVFTSFGLSVTINAYGADMETVEEIINQFR